MMIAVTKLQKLMLDALDQLGSMTRHELEVACLSPPSSRGGFNTSLARLFDRKLVTTDDYQIYITREGVFAIEEQNMADERRGTFKRG